MTASNNNAKIKLLSDELAAIQDHIIKRWLKKKKKDKEEERLVNNQR